MHAESAHSFPGLHVHLQNTALALYNVHPFLLCVCVADRGPASRAGAFAALQAGDGEARSQPQLLLRAGRLQQQEQGGGAGARGQEAQAGTDERFISRVFAAHSSVSTVATERALICRDNL